MSQVVGEKSEVGVGGGEGVGDEGIAGFEAAFEPADALR